MRRHAWLLPILALSVVACDGAAPTARRDGAVPGAGDDAVAETRSVASVPHTVAVSVLVGLWDDGKLGENTKLDLRADGSAHIVSLGVVPATWTFDSRTHRVTLRSRRQADGSTIEQHVTYAPGLDVLTGQFSGPSGPEHRFRRASEEAIAWWARVHMRVERDAATGEATSDR